VIEISSETSSTDTDCIPGRSDWEVSLNHLVTSGAPFEGLLKVRGIYTLRISVGGSVLTGRAICQQADLQGAVGALATGSVKFQGKGPLS
jgi:hypothetical protein